MLQAELHHHALPAAIASEDYLVSTVFGLMKYLDSPEIWARLLQRAETLDGNGQRQQGSLRLQNFGKPDRVDITFWEHHECDIPDLTIRFFRQGTPVLLVLLEAKLNSEKGDAGDAEYDQLVRYAERAGTISSPSTPALVLFLTHGDPLPDIHESMNLLATKADTAGPIFGIQWADVHAACAESRTSSSSSSSEARILGDLARYLAARNLDYFTELRRRELPEIESTSIFSSRPIDFLARAPLPDLPPIRRLFQTWH